MPGKYGGGYEIHSDGNGNFFEFNSHLRQRRPRPQRAPAPGEIAKELFSKAKKGDLLDRQPELMNEYQTPNGQRKGRKLEKAEESNQVQVNKILSDLKQSGQLQPEPRTRLHRSIHDKQGFTRDERKKRNKLIKAANKRNSRNGR